MQLEYTSNPVPLRMQLECFEHAQNIPTGYRNVPKCSECTQNSVGTFRMHFDCQQMPSAFRLIPTLVWLGFKSVMSMIWIVQTSLGKQRQRTYASTSSGLDNDIFVTTERK